MYDPKQQTYTKTEYDIVRAENSDLCDNVDAARQDLEDYTKSMAGWMPVGERLPKPDENTHPQQSVKVRLAKIVEIDAWYEECDKHWHDARTGEVIKGTHWRPITLPEGE